MNHVMKYLLLLRSFAIGAQIFALGVMLQVFGLTIQVLPVVAVLFGAVAATAIAWRRLSVRRETRQSDFVVQLLVDIGALAALVYFTGGSVNPFISLFILPIVFAAAALSGVQTALIAVVAVSSYTLLMFFHVPIAADHLHVSAADLHIWGMWYGFIISAGCVAVFVARIARRLRERDHALAGAREEALKTDRLVALATLATGTAHELGTPLATMAVIANDMEQDLRVPKNKRAMRLLRHEIDRCKSILSKLAVDSGQLQAESGHSTTVDDFLDSLIEDWRQLRPETSIRYSSAGPTPGPTIINDRAIGQAIMNVLNNAADASHERVEVRATWDDSAMSLAVHDDGPGISAKVMERIGKEPLTTKPRGEGLGIGMYLADTTIQRVGGSVELERHAKGGARARIEIPLVQLRFA